MDIDKEIDRVNKCMELAVVVGNNQLARSYWRMFGTLVRHRKRMRELKAGK